MKTRLWTILRILISLFLLGLLFRLSRANLVKIWQSLRSVNLFVFILSFLIFLLSTILMAWRLKIILAAQKVFFSITDMFSLTLIGYFFTNFMPTSLGGDLVKGYYISQKDTRRLTAYTSVFIDRLMGMFSVAIIGAFALALVQERLDHCIITWVVIFLIITCLGFALSLMHQQLLKKIGARLGLVRLLKSLKIDSPVKKVSDVLGIYSGQRKVIFQTLVLSTLAQFISIFSLFLLSKSLLVSLPFGKILLVMPVVFILCMLPITINGLGLREWAFVFFFSPNIGSVAALSLSLLYLAMFLLTSLIGGIIYLFWR